MAKPPAFTGPRLLKLIAGFHAGLPATTLAQEFGVHDETIRHYRRELFGSAARCGCGKPIHNGSCWFARRFLPTSSPLYARRPDP